MEEFSSKVSEAENTAVTGLKAKSSKGRKVKLSWTGDSEASGYQIQYGTSKKFSKSKTKKSTAENLTIKKLKAKKTYYFRGRTYKKVYNPVTDETYVAYGKWSNMGKAKVKK